MRISPGQDQGGSRVHYFLEALLTSSSFWRLPASLAGPLPPSSNPRCQDLQSLFRLPLCEGTGPEHPSWSYRQRSGLLGVSSTQLSIA